MKSSCLKLVPVSCIFTNLDRWSVWKRHGDKIMPEQQGAEIACKALKRSSPDMLIKVGACLKNCSPCNSAPFSTIDGEVITTKS